jgi:hypothetical protein
MPDLMVAKLGRGELAPAPLVGLEHLAVPSRQPPA